MDPSDHSESDPDEVWHETMSQIEDDNSDNSIDTDSKWLRTLFPQSDFSQDTVKIPKTTNH